jgi:hypothetical protein
MADPKLPDRNLNKQNNVQPACRPITLLSYLEAENVSLRQAVVELSLDILTLREPLPGDPLPYVAHAGRN